MTTDRDTVDRTAAWRRIGRWIVPITRGNGLRGKTVWVVRRLLVWYVILLVMLATFQRYLIYQPTRANLIEAERCGFEPGRVECVAVKSFDGIELHGWHVPALLPSPRPGASISPPRPGKGPRVRDASLPNADPHSALSRGGRVNNSGEPKNASRLTVIYFPGNAGHRGHRMIEMDLLSRLGVDVYLFDYRGYGDNSGRPTEANLAQDAHVLWNAVTADRKTDPRHVVLLGESLGGGVATRLADELCNEGTPPAGLVLRSTFSSLADVAAYHYRWLPVRLLLVDRFLSTERIGSVRCPILIFHGTEDTIIPLAFAQRLFAAAPAVSANRTPKAFVALPGANHNDLVQVAGSQYREQLRAFFAGIERSGAELAIRLLSDPAPR